MKGRIIIRNKIQILKLREGGRKISLLVAF